MNKIYKQVYRYSVERFKNEIKWQILNNKINETNTLLQIKSLFKKICFHTAFKIWQRVKAGYFIR